MVCSYLVFTFAFAFRVVTHNKCDNYSIFHNYLRAEFSTFTIKMWTLCEEIRRMFTFLHLLMISSRTKSLKRFG